MRTHESMLQHDAAALQDSALKITRRALLRAGVAAGGGLMLSVAYAQTRTDAAQAVPFAPDAFIRIDRKGLVTLIVPRVEMGQGTYTALPVLVAEELEVDPRDMRLEHAPASDKLYANPMSGFQNTGGSTSIRAHWLPLRRAGAAARLLLVQAAAATWQVEVADCVAEDGHVRHVRSGRRLGYGALSERAATLPLPTDVPLKPADRFKWIGKPLHRLDGADKVNGRAMFGMDARPEGVLVAAIVHCPVVGGRLGSVDDAAARKVRGVRQIVRVDNAVAVVADHYGAARKAAGLLEIAWDEGPSSGYSTERMVEDLARASLKAGAVARKEGDVAAAAARTGARTVEAIYQQPLLAHACMEPVNCTVHVRPDSCELWVGTQVPSRAQTVAAEITGMRPEQVTVNNHLLGGGFGRRLDVDFIAQAVRVARQVNGPIKVIWSREEDTRTSTLRPHHYNRLSAVLDERGMPTAWQHRVTGSSILARWAPARFQNEVDGDAIRDAAGPYAFDNVLIEYVRQEPAAGITTGFWRGVGHMQNAFPVEFFMDELAEAAGVDPIEYRKRLLQKHPRARQVLDLVAARSGWGRPLPRGKGRGVALTFCFNSYAAQVCEVTVDKGQLTVDRIVTVVDCGRTINPDTVTAQMQGGIVFGLSAAQFGDITIANGRIEQGNFDTYRILRLNEMPAVDIHLVSSADEPGGVGEVSTVLVAPSVVNAVHAATGQRVRRLPFSREELKQANG